MCTFVYYIVIILTTYTYTPHQTPTAALQRLYPSSTSQTTPQPPSASQQRLTPDDIDACLQGSGTRLLQHFVEAQAGALASLIKTQGLDAGGVASAIGGSDDITQATWAKPLILRLEALVKELGAALNTPVNGIGLAAGRRGERADLIRLGSNVGAGRGGGVNLDVERLFSVRVEVFAPVDLAVEPVVLAVLRVACKALVERARAATLSLRGYCQLQVDVQLLRQAVGAYVKDPAVLEALLEEVRFCGL